MAKKSKKQRRLLAEKEERRIKAMAKAGEPYSKHKPQEEICCHYHAGGEYRLESTLLGVIETPAHVGSYLKKVDENKFVCTVCGKVFTAEQAGKIDAVCDCIKTIISYFEPKESQLKLQSEIAKLLTEDIAPCRYYIINPNEPVICGTEKVVVPRVDEFRPMVVVDRNPGLMGVKKYVL